MFSWDPGAVPGCQGWYGWSRNADVSGGSISLWTCLDSAPGAGGWPRRWTARAWGRAGGVGCAGKAIKRCEPYYWNANMFIRAWGQEVQMFLENKPHLVVVWRENGNKVLIRLPLSGSVYAGFEWIHPRDFGKQLPQYFSYFQFGKLTLSGEWLKYVYLEIFWADYCFRGRINESVFQKDCKRHMTEAYVLEATAREQCQELSVSPEDLWEIFRWDFQHSSVPSTLESVFC